MIKCIKWQVPNEGQRTFAVEESQEAGNNLDLPMRDKFKFI